MKHNFLAKLLLVWLCVFGSAELIVLMTSWNWKSLAMYMQGKGYFNSTWEQVSDSRCFGYRKAYHFKAKEVITYKPVSGYICEHGFIRKVVFDK